MKFLICSLTLAALLSGAVVVAADSTGTGRTPDWYKGHYPYMKYGGKVISFETEFKWPEGYQRIDSSKLTPFQFWVSNVPLWFKEAAVGMQGGYVMYRPEQISRSVHLPWRTVQFRENVIPLQLLAEFLLWQKRPNDLAVLPKSGAAMTYQAYLGGSPAYDSQLRLFWRPAERKEASPLEFNHFIDVIAANTNYSSLAGNCDSIKADSILPGDLLICTNQANDSGRVYVVLVAAQNNAGKRLYIVGSGCRDACDFHIPLFHNDRSNPWLTLDEVKALALDKLICGFYRLRVP